MSYEYPVRFTHDLLNPENPVLESVVPDLDPSGPHRVAVFRVERVKGRKRGLVFILPAFSNRIGRKQESFGVIIAQLQVGKSPRRPRKQLLSVIGAVFVSRDAWIIPYALGVQLQEPTCALLRHSPHCRNQFGRSQPGFSCVFCHV